MLQYTYIYTYLYVMLYYNICMNICVHIYAHMCIYIYTSVLLCVDTHSECGSICQVDAIVMLTWSKVCITKAIAISITIPITISIQKLSSTVNHTIQKLSFVDNWSDLWKTGQIYGKLVRFVVRFAS